MRNEEEYTALQQCFRFAAKALNLECKREQWDCDLRFISPKRERRDTEPIFKYYEHRMNKHDWLLRFASDTEGRAKGRRGWKKPKFDIQIRATNAGFSYSINCTCLNYYWLTEQERYVLLKLANDVLTVLTNHQTLSDKE